jgi:uncharacterized protein YraI
MTKRSLLAMTAAGLMAAAPALAQVSATVATDLNLREGPGGDQAIVAVIPAASDVTVDGCLETANWCQVTWDGRTGWAYGQYLNAMGADSTELVVVDNRDVLTIPVATFEGAVVADAEGDNGTEAVTGAATGGLLAAALIGGPAAIAAGAALGAAANIADDDPTVTYVRENPVDPIYLDGEVVVGAGIPTEVELVAIPDTEYSYAYINGVPVLVNADRSIVRIVR